MPGYSALLHRKHTSPFVSKKWYTPIIMYSLILFLVSLGDAIMSYIAPIEVEAHVSNTFVMGLVLATSSGLGFVCDFLFGEWFRGKSYAFFLASMFTFAFLFPLSFILAPPIVSAFLFAMAAWGIYFELIQFSNFHFINTYVEREDHASSWGILESLISLAYFLGPLFATFLIDRHVDGPYYGALGFFTTGLFGFLLFWRAHRTRSRASTADTTTSKRSRFHEIKIWAILWKKIWPLYIFFFTAVLVDSTFWTVGALLSEDLRQQHPLGGLLLPAATLPSLFIGLFAGKLAHQFGKKRAAFFAGSCAGLILAVAGILQNVPLLIGTVLLFAVFHSVSRPEISATFEDYISRLGKTSNDLIGLQNSAASLAWVIGPIISGAFASWIGNSATLSVVGIIMFVVAVMALVVVPRKIQMPQKELEIAG
ncbi:MAG TPA: MFS transporter [Patescibacteria group bacterium]|nr:MFS transporter [Patescibacteria group bacterium]